MATRRTPNHQRSAWKGKDLIAHSAYHRDQADAPYLDGFFGVFLVQPQAIEISLHLECQQSPAHPTLSPSCDVERSGQIDDVSDPQHILVGAQHPAAENGCDLLLGSAGVVSSQGLQRGPVLIDEVVDQLLELVGD